MHDDGFLGEMTLAAAAAFHAPTTVRWESSPMSLEEAGKAVRIMSMLDGMVEDADTFREVA